MAQNKSSQRGVVRMTAAIFLAGVAALLSLAGCSDAAGSGEDVAGVREAICGVKGCACGLTTCTDFGPCVTTTCSITNTCVYTDAAELSACKTATAEGVCVTKPRTLHPMCCTGCHVNGAVKGAYDCVNAPTAAQCGVAGGLCTNCDGGDICTKYSCDTVTGQCGDKMAVPDTEACTDNTGSCWKGSCCTGCIDKNDACQPGTGVGLCGKSGPGKLVACKSCVDTETVCTTDTCNADGTCSNAAVANNTPCLDANKCDGAESCQAGKCTDQANFSCPADGNVCHAPTCDANGCGQQLLTGTTCPDANLCNGVEKCNNGVCNVPGTPKNCNDNNPCTVDDCDPKTGACINTPVSGGELCENGDVCDGIGVCDDNAQCVVQPAQPCDNSDPCKVYTCDKVKGCVVSSFTTAACNDGDPCTTVDKCNGAGACVGGTIQKCDDGNECTTDSCVPFQGCKAVAGNEGGTCDDGNNCSTGDKCVSGKCLASGGKTCPDDTNPCTTASCDPANQICGQSNDNTAKCQSDKCHQFTTCTNGTCPVGAPIDCADTNPCTKDECDPATGCTHTPDDTATCSDGDLCTEGDACKGGECVTKPVVCEAVDDCHKVGSCNAKSGFCDAPRADVGTSCENDTGKCDDKGKCIPNPVTGEGGAGGEPTGVAGAGAGMGGNPVAEGGSPTVTPGEGGTGNEAMTGGEPGTVESGGKAGKSSGGSATTAEGGEPEVPEHVFVRTPGGCSCNVPSSPQGNLAWLAGLAAVGVLARRRRLRSTACNKAGRP